MDDYGDDYQALITRNMSNSTLFNESNPRYKRANVDFVYLSVEILLTVVAVTSIVANVLTSFVILKFEKLRKETTNMLLLNLHIVEMLFLISIAIMVWMETLGIIGFHCMPYELEGALVLCLFLLLIVMTTDGCMQTCSQNYHESRRICVYLFLAVAYGATVVAAYFMSDYCTYSNNFYMVTLYFDMFFSLGMLVFVFIMNVVHRTKTMCSTDSRAAPSTNNVGLAITNIFMLAWATVYPAVLVAIYGDSPNLDVVLIYVAVAFCLAIPVFKFIYLYRCHEDFNVVLRRTLRCECSDYGSEALPSVAYNEASGVLIPQQSRIS